jgi:hypothetical protein
MNYDNDRYCKTYNKPGYINHSYIPYNKHPLRYLQQVLDNEKTKILELQTELKEL